MSALIVLFDLKPGVDPKDYERWAQEIDVPVVGHLESIDQFRVYRLGELLLGEGSAPYAYCEVIDVNDLTRLREELACSRLREIALQFQELADNQVFVVAKQIA